MKFKVGDQVLVITGKDRGKTGAISQVIAERGLVVVDGVNTMVKHMKTNQKDQKGQRIEYFGPIHSSNVMMIDQETGKPGRVGYTVSKGSDGKTLKTRVVKPSKSRAKVTVKADKKDEKPAKEEKAVAPAKAEKTATKEAEVKPAKAKAKK